MTDRPIIFSGPMVLALLDGRNVMTRRLAWREQATTTINQVKISPTHWQKVEPGDRLWVRESGHLLREAYEHEPRVGDIYRDAGFIHTADSTIVAARTYDTPITDWIGDCARVNRPSIHMPRWASRLTLVVTATKVERLQDISDGNARAEGVESTEYWRDNHPPSICFSVLWDALHGPGSWDANPEVVAMSFRVIKANIDTLEARAA